MRILAISYVLPPALYPQAIQVGRLLARLPAEIGAVGGRLAAAEDGLGRDPALERRLAFRLEIEFRPALSGALHALGRRVLPFYAAIPDEFRGWVAGAERAVLTRLAAAGFRPQAVVSFGEPMADHLLGLRLQRRLGLPWVAHFSDPWADNPFRRGRFLSAPVNRRQEAAVVAAASRIVFTSQETLDLVMRKYPAGWRGKAAVLPHAFDPALYPAPGPKQAGIVVRYLGSLYGRRNPLPLCRALQLIRRRDPGLLDGVRFELVGRTPPWLPWHPLFRALPPGLLVCVGTVSYRRSLQLMVDADLLLVIDAPDRLSVFLPSKLIDYLGAGVPIAGIVPPGSSAALLARLGAVVADPRRPDSVAHGLAAALALVRARRAEPNPAPWGDPAIRERYRAERIAAEFAAILDAARETASGAPPGLAEPVAAL